MTTNPASSVGIQPLQFADLSSTLSQLPSSINQLSGTTFGPSQRELQTQLLSPTAQQAMTGAQQAAAYAQPVGQNLYNTGADIAGIGTQMGQQAQSIFPYAQQVFQTGMDPQSQLYNWLQNQNMQQTQAQNAAAGVGTTPYGASVADQSNMLFNINWQNQQLQRQIDALQAGAGAIQTGTGIEQAGAGVQQAGVGLETAAPSFINQTSGIPYATRSGITGTSLGDIAQFSNLQNLPITDLLGLLTGQNQTNQVGNQTSQTGLAQSALEMQQLAGLASGAGSLFGGLLGGTTGQGVNSLTTLGSGLSKLFSGSSGSSVFG
jgi:hypothetical protein